MSRKPTQTEPLPPAILSPGMFIVLTAVEAELHMLHDGAIAALYDGLRIAEERAREPIMARLTVVQSAFGREARSFLPAGTSAALWFYVEHYDGDLRDRVRGLAASVLTGKLNMDHGDGGQRVRVTDLPHPPTSPAPAYFPVQA